MPVMAPNKAQGGLQEAQSKLQVTKVEDVQRAVAIILGLSSAIILDLDDYRCCLCAIRYLQLLY
jgi:hypothetical protein